MGLRCVGCGDGLRKFVFFFIFLNNIIFFMFSLLLLMGVLFVYFFEILIYLIKILIFLFKVCEIFRRFRNLLNLLFLFGLIYLFVR